MTATAMRNGTRWVSANDTVSRVALSGAGDALQFKTLPSGHFMALQTPELFVAEVEAFLRPLDI